jgi:hypothetical protein
MSGHDLLSPTHLGDLYVHQVRQTIDAYDPQHIVLGETLQNALDAVVEAGGNDHLIELTINFAQRSVTVTDDGVGFPNRPELLFLGGTSKLGRGLYGMIGAGLKVVLFSTEQFSLRARGGAGHFRVDIADAFRFDADAPPDLTVGDSFDPDSAPLPEAGTSVSYTFAESSRVFASCFDRITEACLPARESDPLLATLAGAVSGGTYPTRLAALIALFLRRFTYVGDVRQPFGTRPGPGNLTIRVTLECGDGSTLPTQLMRELADGQETITFQVAPSYATVEDTALSAPPPRVSIFSDPLGRGGQNMTRTAHGFNHLRMTTPDEYKSLLLNENGDIRGDGHRFLEEFEQRLFPNVNGISLTIGRIPDFERCLPSGSRRVISANGIVTIHDLNFDTGRNQEYVRCFDFVIDVDAKLNYGKTQITDPHLVNRIRRFVNAAYGAVISKAARNFVGRISDIDDDDDDQDVFLERVDLGIDELVLRKQPTSEQDVIALFFELAGRGQFDAYRVYGLSSKDRYDSRAAIVTDARPRERAFAPARDGDLRVVEFKHTASEVIRDFERDLKEPRAIDLLIAWREGVSPSDHYHFEDIEHSGHYRRNPQRVFPGVERYIQDSRTGAEIQVLLLDRVIEKQLEVQEANTDEKKQTGGDD